jgi:hypothetical protein
MIIPRSVLLRMRNVSDKRCRKNQTTYFVSNNFFDNHAVYEISWKNIVGPDGPQMIIRRMRITYWITKATDTHSEYVTLIPFPQQQWLQERASTLLYT